MTTWELFCATKYPETTSLFAPYEVFPLHQDIFSNEGCVWNGICSGKSWYVSTQLYDDYISMYSQRSDWFRIWFIWNHRRVWLVSTSMPSFSPVCLQVHIICVSKCSLYVFTIIPPRLSDPRNFITVLLATREPAEQTTLLFWSAACSVKPVLNWANVCSPNILRTLRRTMIRFLIELLVRRIWFGQSKFYFIHNWLVMRCKLRP